MHRRVVFIVLLSLAGLTCGLPQYSKLDIPQSASSGETKVLAFSSPADETNVKGYLIYYKVYSSNENNSRIEDERSFELNATKTSGIIRLGAELPKSLDFVRAGKEGKDNFLDSRFLIPHSPNATYYIDFNHAYPAIGTNLPVPDPPLLSMARGYIDPTQTSDKTFLSFENDNWDFDDGDPDDFYDGDLRRPPPPQPGSDPLTGNPIFPENPGILNIDIAFCVYAFGIDPRNLNPLVSRPLYLDVITIQGLRDVDRTR